MQGKVKAGISTISLGGVSVVAYVLAVLAFVDGQRDETTIGLVATGTVALVTMAAGRFWQAVEKIRAERRTPTASVTSAGLLAMADKQRVSTGTNVVSAFSEGGVVGAHLKTDPPMSYTRSGGLGAGVLNVGDPEDDEPGDELHPAFDGEQATDPDTIPPDTGESEAALAGVPPGVSAFAARSGAVSGLDASQRAKAREMVIQAAYLGFKHAPKVHYTQGARRWEGIVKKLRAWRGEYPKYADCSSFATWVLWQGLWHFHVRDVVNGAAWRAGYTGTMLEHGKVVRHEKNVKYGDLALYEGHVAICVGGGMVISHGSEGGPYLLSMHYRSDLIEVRRYI